MPGKDSRKDRDEKDTGARDDKWRKETAKRNEDAIGRALKQQEDLERRGYRYNKKNGTWVKPSEPTGNHP